MEIYILLLCVLMIPILLNLDKSKQFVPDFLHSNKIVVSKKVDYKWLVFWSLLLLLVIISGFRDVSVGTDTAMYKSMFDNFNISNLRLINLLEIGYNFLVIIIKSINLPFTVLLLILSLIYFSVFFRFIKNYSCMPFVAVFFFVALGIFAGSFNGARQFLALVFFVLSMDGLINKRPLKYFLCCVGAFLCHNSAIVLFPIYALRYFKINWKFVLITSILVVLALVLLPQIMQAVSLFTKRDYYEYYYLQGKFTQGVSIYNVLYILGMIGIFAFLWFTKKFVKEEKDKTIYNIFLMFFFVAVCIRFIATFSGIFSLVNRFTMYFFWSLIILIPLSLKYFFSQKLIKYYKVLLYVFGIIYFIISAGVRESNDIFPYKFIFDKFSFGWFIVLFMLAITCIGIIYFSIKAKKVRELNLLKKEK